MTNKHLLFILAFSFILTTISCEKDDPEIPNEEELITTLTYTLTPSSGGDGVIMTFTDLDGDGGDAPVISGGTLAANTTYTGSLDLLNALETPAESITEEIEEEDEEHQFFFESTVADVNISYNDVDADGNPVGLSSTLTTGDAADGNITITLRHEPNKTATGVSTGDITNAGGETDIEVTFPVDVQ
ncbi:MAG: hypothetical protein ACPG4Z_07060 [Chitinophagales bacterium]